MSAIRRRKPKRQLQNDGSYCSRILIKRKQGVKKKHLTPRETCCMISQVIEMEKIVEQGLLYDFYGELLTEHQKSIYEDVVFNDLSLSEIAKEKGISRQGVHDMIKRCDKILNGYEEKLGLVKKFRKTRELVEEINSLTGEFLVTEDKELIKRVGQISNDILKLV